MTLSLGKVTHNKIGCILNRDGATNSAEIGISVYLMFLC